MPPLRIPRSCASASLTLHDFSKISPTATVQRYSPGTVEN